MINIYALIDPRDGLARYIGKTNNRIGRLQQHERKSHNQDVQKWLGELSNLGLEVKMEILERVPMGEDWRIAESYWMREAFKQGWPILNKVAGGDGVPLKFISDSNPDASIFRSLRISKNTAILLAGIETRSQNLRFLLLHLALNLLHISDISYEKYTQLTSRLNKLPKWLPFTKRAKLRMNRRYSPKRGVYKYVLSMKKKTGDLLDELAAKKIDNRRRGYDATINLSLMLLKQLCDKHNTAT